MTYEEIVSRVAADTGLPTRLVDRSYRAFWKAVREHIKSLPLKEDLTDGEFMALQPNVNIPSIGKLYVTIGRYRRMKECHEMIENRYGNSKNNSNAEDKESEAPIHGDSDNRREVQ